MNNFEQWKKYRKEELPSYVDQIKGHIDENIVKKFCLNNPDKSVPEYLDYYEEVIGGSTEDDHWTEDGSFRGWSYEQWLEHFCECNGENY